MRASSSTISHYVIFLSLFSFLFFWASTEVKTPRDIQLNFYNLSFKRVGEWHCPYRPHPSHSSGDFGCPQLTQATKIKAHFSLSPLFQHSLSFLSSSYNPSYKPYTFNHCHTLTVYCFFYCFIISLFFFFFD